MEILSILAALDQILTEDVGEGRTNPAMRLWRYRRPIRPWSSDRFEL